ncbi:MULTISPECIES: TRAP transporter large permease subunit [Dethiosulfovibrio]|uniref:TRAP transporter large permease subunit n=2 Tax=Dethiosulfovibrio TaxID=47054 RepID=A0ABS9ERB4_9BACT|nr:MULTISPECIES: TRAP transporter large permease subunit [Dethiosulfovibrio]MCF4114592.1 TRAP transporter large permease subunit [Dethiosulfovibrio russensis]MCF4142816.1 TRAP transporter large permease subunit [Dethiosulfovibrio marinus]MCF4144855.1 TRAP transporter large permease subunit [Dethiosulfovibrio acidaminovorans]MEA3283878.1 TRAP transporter large permease subunit [Synergistota bacterium]
MSWFWPEGMYTLLMIGVFAFAAFAWKLPIAVAMALAAISGALASGNGVPIRHLVEGEFGYIDTILIIATAMIFMKVIQRIGLLDSVAAWVIRRFRNYPVFLSLGIMFLIMVPGMITGSSTAAVLTTGALVAPVLIKLGVPVVKTAAAISMGALFGMIAPPISIPAMIIGAGVDIPYVGFGFPLLICTLPLAVICSLLLIYPYVRKERDEVALDAELTRMSGVALTPRLFLPVVVLVVLLGGERIFPHIWPSLGMPLDFLLASAAGLLSGSRWNPLETVTEAVDEALPVMGILMGVGMFIQIMTLTGVRGFVVVSALALPSWTLYLGIATSMPLFGAVSSFGSASVLGVPFLLALLGQNEIVVASALSLVASLGDLMPPTALAGIFAAQVVGEDNYFKVLRHCMFPAVLTAGWGIAVILMAKPLAKLIF